MLMYKCLSGRAPFAAANYNALMVAIMTEPPPPLTQWVPPMPAIVSAIIEDCLRKDRSERIPSASALVVRIDEALLSLNAERVKIEIPSRDEDDNMPTIARAGRDDKPSTTIAASPAFANTVDASAFPEASSTPDPSATSAPTVVSSPVLVAVTPPEISSSSHSGVLSRPSEPPPPLVIAKRRRLVLAGMGAAAVLLVGVVWAVQKREVNSEATDLHDEPVMKAPTNNSELEAPSEKLAVKPPIETPPVVSSAPPAPSIAIVPPRASASVREIRDLKPVVSNDPAAIPSHSAGRLPAVPVLPPRHPPAVVSTVAPSHTATTPVVSTVSPSIPATVAPAASAKKPPSTSVSDPGFK
ncbi:MAG: hypothetical protein NVSMB1_17230 [Polyangiales bacterium]